MNKRLLRVAVPAPLPRLFDYWPPPGQSLAHCLPGMRVRVPFARTYKIGVIVAQVSDSQVAPNKLRAVSAVLDEQPLLSEADLAFLQWTAHYYHHPIGEVVLAALPLRLRKQPQALPLTTRVCCLQLAAAEAQQAVARAPRQQAVLQQLLQAQGCLPLEKLRSQCGIGSDVLQRMQAKGIVRISDQAAVATEPDQYASEHTLHPQQQTAVQAVEAQLSTFAAFLLEGITGSGKTEVYLQLAQQVLAQGRSVMLLVPEISLTPQLQASFCQRLGDTVTVMHSGLSENERELAWQRVRLGLSRMVLGTRSLVFNPVHKLGLMVVDEEHDTSFKQQDGLRYSARDLAVIRAQRANCPVVLGSATPALESLHNAQTGRYQHLRMVQRVGGAQTPRIQLLDIRDQPLQAGISPVLRQALGQVLAAGEQAMVFLNRRGFAPVLTCYSCAWVSDCQRCDARQTVHRKAQLLWCHHCGAQRPLPVVCPACGKADVHSLGQGTEQLEQNLAAQFPDVPLLRVDRDATARKGSLQRLLKQVHHAEAALLVGTQMLAKGHHFPRVTLVGVLGVDGGLFGADFRSAERMAQLLMQVAGRAGRGERPGQVLVQTRYPEHPLLQTLIHENYAAFAQVALAERQAAGYPPFRYQALLRAEATKVEPPEQFLQQVSDYLSNQAVAKPVERWGPVPAPMARRVGKYRAHLLLQTSQREALHATLRLLQQQVLTLPGARQVRWSLDVDPLDTY